MKAKANIGILFLVGVIFLSPLMGSAGEPVKELIGAGASFPYPLYSKWFDVYAKTHGIKVNYQSIGSGGGIRQLLKQTVDFGASDAFLSEEEKKKFEGDVLHIPTALGGVAVVYNLPVKRQLRITPEILSDIFTGKIKNWQDPKIKQVNPDVKLPKLPIIVVHRSDGSGTTFIFTDYLSKVSPAWKDTVGRGKSIKWPAGIGGKGNEGVAGSVKQLPGSIGYVEVIYAEKNKLKYALIKNKCGKFVAPTLKGITEAANVDLPDDLRVSITDTSGQEGYPIAGFTWILVYQDQKYANRSFEKAKAVKELIYWCVTNAQQYNERLLYSPLPVAAGEKALKLVRSISYDGKAIKLDHEKK